MKQNAQTNQTKLINKSNETQTNPRWNAHMQHNRERDRKRKESVREREKKRLWPMMADREVRDGGSGNRFLKRRWRRWEQRWRHGVESEGLFESPKKRVIDLSLVVRVSLVVFQFRVFLLLRGSSDLLRFPFFLIYTKPKAAFYKGSSVWIEATFY